MRPNRPIYLDHHATTPLDPRVLAAMRPWWEENFANPHSVEHAMGRAAEEAVEEARAHVAALIGADPREIVFTSGATESNNIAIKGAARFAGVSAGSGEAARGESTAGSGEAARGGSTAGSGEAARGGSTAGSGEAARGGSPGPRRIITLATEHKCVLESVRDLAAEGFEAVILPVRPDGLLELDVLRAALETPTLLVSVMAANNETGVVQDLAAIGALVKAAGALFHTDAAQAAGRIALDVSEIQADLLSLSGHKMYGPKGVGALYVRRRPRVRLTPLFSGGGQERGLRSGTLPAPLLVGLGEAARIALAEGMLDAGRIAGQRQRLLDGLHAAIPGLRINGSLESRVAGNLNLTFPGVDAQSLLAALPDLCLSTGSACSSAEIAPSYVLGAMGIVDSEARGTLRIGLGRFTSPAEMDRAAAMIGAAWQRLASTQHAAE